MTSRELRNQRREAERQARKLEYRQSRNFASAPETCRAGSVAGEPAARPASEPSNEPAVLACEARLLQHLSEAKTQERSGPTGPRTPEGKTTSSGNSLKHGLASGRVIIPGEDPAEFEALLADLIPEHSPATETEALLVQQMAQSWWLTQRAIRIQNQAFAETGLDTHKLALFLRYQTTHERAFYRAFNSLIKLRKERRKSDPEFVSQNAVGAMHASPVSQESHADPEFVSQAEPQTRRETGFVSQKEPISDR